MKEEPCHCPYCQNFYKEHDRLIREFPTFKQQQEFKWASVQSFITLYSTVTEELQDQLSDKENKEQFVENKQHIYDMEITDAIEQLENVNTNLYSIEALMERIFGIKFSKNVEVKFQEIFRKLA